MIQAFGVSSGGGCTREIDSTPPASTARAPSCAIMWPPMAMACNPLAQKRFTVVPATVSGRPARITACRAMLRPVAPCG